MTQGERLAAGGVYAKGKQPEVVEANTNLWHTTVDSNHRQRNARRVPVSIQLK